jgi:hypothetical protein
MTSTEKKQTDITTMENHAPAPPALGEAAPQEPQTSAASTDEKIVTLENHAPLPPALDRNGK